MTSKKTQKLSGYVPLVIEPHPKEYNGYPFITLIQYRRQQMLTIVDNSTSTSIDAYILDYCGAENVDEERLILTAAEWYEHSRDRYPVSFEFSRRGMTTDVSRIYRSLNIEYIARVIGPVAHFPMNKIRSIKRRRRKSIPAGVEVHYIALSRK